MAQTIRRGGKGVRRAAAARGTKAKVAKARRTTGSVFDRAVRVVPISEERLHQGFLAVILGGAVVLAWVVASFAGVPAMAEAQLASLASSAGFEVRRVEVRGVKRMNELKVYEKVLGERDRAMPLVDVAALRDELLQLSWVDDARVSRQLPDALVIDIVERVPHAVLKKPGRYVLIDAAGHELEPVGASRAKAMMVLAGPGAGRQVASLSRLLDTAPALKPKVREAEWIGNRRWNLTFKTGQVLALPQGDPEAASALVSFAKLDGVNRLLGGQVAYFDMRAADRIYLRVPGHADELARERAAKAAARAKAQED
jgi:cell division protein FtsQ